MNRSIVIALLVGVFLGLVLATKLKTYQYTASVGTTDCQTALRDSAITLEQVRHAADIVRMRNRILRQQAQDMRSKRKPNL